MNQARTVPAHRSPGSEAGSDTASGDASAAPSGATPPVAASPAAPPAAAPRRAPSPALVVAIACVAQFMIVLDSTIVAVALPAMRAGLRLSAEQQQWVVDAYLVALGGFLLLAARTGDLVGHRRVFRVGLVVFTLASLAGGLAGSGGTLVAARVAQGLGAAALAPSSLSLAATTFADAARRTKALTLWSLAGGSAGAVGVVLGGVLTAELDWRWVLFVNVPVGVVLFLAARSLPRQTARSNAVRLDIPGALLATSAASILIFGLSRAPSHGWGSGTVLAALIAAPVLLVLFVLVESRSAWPLVPLSLFRSRGLTIGDTVTLFLGATMTAVMVLITLYLQQCLGYSALRAGLSLFPMTVVLIVGTLISRLLMAVIGPRTMLFAGALVAAAAMAWLSALPVHSAYLAHVFGPSVLAGLGISFMLLPLTSAGTSGIDPANAGSAAGLMTTARQLGGAIGLAVFTTIADFATRSAGSRDPISAAVHGYRIAFLANAGLLLFAAIAALALPQRPDSPAHAHAATDTDTDTDTQTKS